jgi:hypothetical protein
MMTFNIVKLYDLQVCVKLDGLICACSKSGRLGLCILSQLI